MCCSASRKRSCSPLRTGTRNRKVSTSGLITLCLLITETLQRDPVAVNVMNTFVLADLIGPEITVNSINPGFCHSGLMRESVGIRGMIAA